LIIISCESINTWKNIYTAKKIFKNWNNVEILLPNKKKYNHGVKKGGESRYKIVTPINSECKGCLKELLAWQKLYRRIELFESINLTIYINTIDTILLKSELKELGIQKELYNNIYFDMDNYFYLENKLYLLETKYHTFVLDEKNKICFMGNPAQGENIENLFFKKLEFCQNKNNVKN
jgi:hypothetical protein